jgi:hypothetical protein
MQINSPFAANNVVLASRPIGRCSLGYGGPKIEKDYIDLDENGIMNSTVINDDLMKCTEPTLNFPYSQIKEFGQAHGLSVVTQDDFIGKVPCGETATMPYEQMTTFAANRPLSSVASSVAPFETTPPHWGFDLSNDTFLVYQPKPNPESTSSQP